MVGLPPGNWVLNSKDRKKLFQALEKQFGISALPESVYIQNAKEKVYMINRDIERVDFERLFIDSLGLYLGGWQIDGFRLSMEGSQLLAPLATKNIIELSKEQRVMWLKGQDIPFEDDTNRFVIVKYKDDILGCGKVRVPKKDELHRETVLLNFVPKARRLLVINE